MLSSSNSRIARNTLFLYIRMFVVLIVALYTTRVVLRSLGVEDFGIYNVVAGFVSMFSFLNTSLINSIQRFYNYENAVSGDNSIRVVFSTSIFIQLVLIVFITIILETIGIWYINNEMVIPPSRLTAANWVFQFSVFSLIVLLIQIPFSSAIMAFEKMDFYAIVSIIDAGLKLAIAVAIQLYDGDKLVFYAGLIFLISLIDLLLYYLYCHKHFPQIRLLKVWNLRLFRNMLSFSGWNMVDSIAYTLQGQGLNLIINAFTGPIVNAARGIAAQIQSALQGFSSNIVVAFKPQLTESYAQGNESRVRRLLYSQSKLSFIMLAVLSLPVILELDYILKLWLVDSVPSYTASFTILVLINMVIGSLNTPMTQVVQATGNVRDYQLYHSIIIALTLPVSWFLLHIGYNVMWVFYVALFTTIINQGISMYFLRRVFEYKYSEYLKEVICPCLLFTLIMSTLPTFLVLFTPSSFWRLLGTCVLSVISAAVALYLGVLNNEERSLIRELLHRIKK